MAATSALVLLLILSFAADKVVKALMFALSNTPWWRRVCPDPEAAADEEGKAAATRRSKLWYAILVAILAGVAVFFYKELRILQMLAGPQTPDLIDMVVTVIVIMGGSDLVSRLLQVSGIGDIGTAPTAGSGRDQPIEIQGRLVLENPRRSEERASLPETAIT